MIVIDTKKLMDIDEWQADFDEWEMPLEDSYTGQAPKLESSNTFATQNTTNPTSPQVLSPSQKTTFPEIEIGSSSDDEAPPPPPSTQLARENMLLRKRMSNLKQASLHAETMNETLKKQLFSFRNIFKNQMKNSFFTLPKSGSGK